MTNSTNKTNSSAQRLAISLATFATGATFVFLTIAMPGTAHAAPPEAFRSEAVSYRDLDLASEAGAKKLHQRIYRAARRVCESEVMPLNARYGRKSACVRETARIGHAMAARHIAEHRAAAMDMD